MNFLQKTILIFAISISINHNDADGMQQQIAPEQVAQNTFDLPNETPGLQGNNHTLICLKTINQTSNIVCLHVVVPNTAAHKMIATTKGLNAKEQMDQMDQIIACSGNIYFPRNGRQPTTQEAVKYSCANIDNTPESPITLWYIQMFGIEPFRNTMDPQDNDFVKAGFEKANGCQIFLFKSINIDTTQIPDPENADNTISSLDLWKRNFKKIASTSVGRVLLYRILIEIRRLNSNKAPSLEEGIIPLDQENLDKRRENRCIIPLVENSESYYYNLSHTIGIRTKYTKHTVIGTQNIELQSSPISCSLFHEMLHWFHYLRDPKRHITECDHLPIARRVRRGLGIHKDCHHALIAYYWGSQTPNKENVNIQWSNVEEMRTIIGSSRNIKKYSEGDDLSESLYRKCIKEYIRFGHCRNNFNENIEVLNKVKQTLEENYFLYK